MAQERTTQLGYRAFSRRKSSGDDSENIGKIDEDICSN